MDAVSARIAGLEVSEVDGQEHRRVELRLARNLGQRADLVGIGQ